MEGVFYKSLAKPVLQLYVPVYFLYLNYILWFLVGAITHRFFFVPIVFGVSCHGVVALIVFQHPLIFHKLWRLIVCRFRNLKRGAFGAAYYSPVNFKNSINYKR